jgi:hypothetical protein
VVDLLEASADHRLQALLLVVAEYSYREQESTGHLGVPSASASGPDLLRRSPQFCQVVV